MSLEEEKKENNSFSFQEKNFCDVLFVMSGGGGGGGGVAGESGESPSGVIAHLRQPYA